MSTNDDLLIGRGWRFPVGVDATGGIGVSSHNQEIEEAIAIIIGTSPGERVMRPAFGCRIHELVFAPNSPETVGLARRYVLDALGMWEPRITVEHVDVSADADARVGGRMNITVTYTIRSTKDRRSLVYPFYLIEPE
ncbi:MAG: GPW/gp25 family protein [Dehalococcoidia bacterium]|nr:GPW/gp25 family protein [Dehalococcoidia bacterium]